MVHRDIWNVVIYTVHAIKLYFDIFLLLVEFKPKLESGCKDYEDICAKWVRYGQCRKHYDARKYCPKSCRICGKLPTVEPPVLSKLSKLFGNLLRLIISTSLVK